MVNGQPDSIPPEQGSPLPPRPTRSVLPLPPPLPPGRPRDGFAGWQRWALPCFIPLTSVPLRPRSLMGPRSEGGPWRGPRPGKGGGQSSEREDALPTGVGRHDMGRPGSLHRPLRQRGCGRGGSLAARTKGELVWCLIYTDRWSTRRLLTGRLPHLDPTKRR